MDTENRKAETAGASPYPSGGSAVVRVDDLIDLIRGRARVVRPDTGEVVDHTRAREDRAQLQQIVDRLSYHTDLSPVPLPTGWRTPVIGQLWLVFRRRLHQEMRIHLDVLFGRQTSFNRLVVGALQALVAAAQAGSGAVSQTELANLRAEVDSLKAEVLTLRARVESSEPGGPDESAAE